MDVCFHGCALSALQALWRHADIAAAGDTLMHPNTNAHKRIDAIAHITFSHTYMNAPPSLALPTV